ncbi:class I SAM-dependent methyltransferase [Rhodococcus gannanensis]|uniref:Class I SAM-dependent methyltransferase n=1 Tax=Rhodococcus gannanensis TaxID=1960308 RepID=A0ABW4P4B8_9NOCA
MPLWDGNEYAEVSALQRTLAGQALAGISLVGDERVLDIGCGDGLVTLELAARVPRGSVVGVDASPGMIETASHRPVPAGATARFQVADARDLPFAGDFDLVVSFNALHWVPEQERALRSLAHVLRPGGRAVLQMVCASDRPSVEDVEMEVAARPEWAPAFDGFTAPFVHPAPDEYEALAASAGLAVTGRRTWEVEWDFGSRWDFLRWCTVGSTDWTRRLEPDRVPRFMGDVVAAYEGSAGRPGLFRFSQMRIELVLPEDG